VLINWLIVGKLGQGGDVTIYMLVCASDTMASVCMSVWCGVQKVTPQATLYEPHTAEESVSISKSLSTQPMSLFLVSPPGHNKKFPGIGPAHSIRSAACRCTIPGYCTNLLSWEYANARSGLADKNLFPAIT
jgi:hypothetical protein